MSTFLLKGQTLEQIGPLTPFSSWAIQTHLLSLRCMSCCNKLSSMDLEMVLYPPQLISYSSVKISILIAAREVLFHRVRLWTSASVSLSSKPCYLSDHFLLSITDTNSLRREKTFLCCLNHTLYKINSIHSKACPLGPESHLEC